MAARFSCLVGVNFLAFAAAFLGFATAHVSEARRKRRGQGSSSAMQLDFEIQRSTRRCAATDRALEPGEICYSVLEVHGAEIVRKDFAASAWSGPPAEAFGWWKSRVPEPHAKKIKLAPNEVLLELFDQLAERPESEDMRYVLALLVGATARAATRWTSTASGETFFGRATYKR